MSAREPDPPVLPRVHCRWMIPRDLAAVEEIDRLSHAEPWGLELIQAILRQRQNVGITAETNDTIAGWLIYNWPRHPDDCMEVIGLAVHPAFRLRGVGRALLARLATKAATNGRPGVKVRVDEYDLPAQKFLRACGLACVRSEVDRAGAATLVFEVMA